MGDHYFSDSADIYSLFLNRNQTLQMEHPPPPDPPSPTVFFYQSFGFLLTTHPLTSNNIC